MAAAPVVLTHPSSLGHLTPPGHPERPARMTTVMQALDACGSAGALRLESPPAERADLLRIHPESHLVMIEGMAAAGGLRIDGETVVSPGSWEAARHAAGGAVELVRRLLSGAAGSGFSLHRPPGHHAEPGTAMGFCLVNNVAVAAAYALEVAGLERVMIVDYDVHHGNGTNVAFHRDPRALFVSIHQSPLYPGTGPLSDVGSGAGEGFSVNLPVAPGAGDDVFRSLVDGVVVPLALAHEPQLLLVSAGFDAAAEDPLADCTVTADGFAGMTASLCAVAGELGVPIGAVLEGGYALQSLGAGVAAALQALAGQRSGAPLAGASVREVADARAFLARWWPSLAPVGG